MERTEEPEKSERSLMTQQNEYKKSDIVVNINFDAYPPRKTNSVIKLSESHQTDYDPNFNFVKKKVPTVKLPKHNLDDDIR